MDAEVIVIGGAVVGAALAYGFAKQGRRVVVLDGEDQDMRAARANFGLVWVQGKGSNAPAYHQLSRQSADLWPVFLRELTEMIEMRVDYSRPGGMTYCLSDAEYEAREALNKRTHNYVPQNDTRMVDRRELERMMPTVAFGPEVVGASFCEADGHVNPLQLLAALQRGIAAAGGKIIFRNTVSSIKPGANGFTVTAALGTYTAPRVVVAAGLATPSLTDPLGFKIPLRSERGQLLVTERLEPFLPYPGSGLRQTADGTVMIGATKEDAADRGVTVASATKLALRATRIIPALASARLVRQWSGFRVMPPDGSPIYAESADYPGLLAAACHSGVTLAAAHAAIVAPAMLEGRLSTDLPAFSNGRFDVQKCA
ncbi:MULTISPECIES: NAD(P)/FAD-dependent oxidoreductase [Agrobacterium]|uniref:FAD-dependent oxidoreductase n=1 Tax=Agrobacterium rosae TaxID=1972867 RepID=A0AAW9FLP8_9HYPH|nr:MULTISPECIES: FAD-dependent oxidoreductase [Agrobacterium]MDX8321445.1 FAD-dependent oxidoreductase [Agrobacterium sp. rho-8.1]MCW8060801.1 FAD-binding oxidoreductase [Agrobacterium tumefaciens]MDX8305502.1 FAD-dependent oxidoreductase [Agrobacterium rosae]MDX8310988.1 FAD-dependent oxidoreductase [Agrobacterium sp. rho-13.3]MDX8316877.1 FAD-dependent oxidoreductase [Agrobacterium rosae]